MSTITTSLKIWNSNGQAVKEALSIRPESNDTDFLFSLWMKPLRLLPWISVIEDT